MKIMFSVYTLAGGGAERVISILSDNLSNLGFDVSLILVKRVQDEYYINPKVKIYTIENFGYRCQEGNKLSRTYKRVEILRGILKENKPDYIFAFLGNMIRDVYVASVGTGVRVIGALRVNPQNMSKFDRFCLNYVFDHCAAVFLQTYSQKKFISKKAEKRSFVVPNPVNSEIIEAGKEKEYNATMNKIVTCGRLSPQKNHKMLIEAMIQVHQLHSKVRLEIYGSGSEESSLKDLIQQKNADSYIFLKGRSNNVIEILLQADIFVLSSNYEGMPNALMEAMAMGLPCISTDCLTGPRELIGENERGILVEIDHISAMVDAICILVEKPSLGIEYGQNARNFILNNYTPEIITQQLLANINNK